MISRSDWEPATAQAHPQPFCTRVPFSVSVFTAAVCVVCACSAGSGTVGSFSNKTTFAKTPRIVPPIRRPVGQVLSTREWGDGREPSLKHVAALHLHASGAAATAKPCPCALAPAPLPLASLVRWYKVSRLVRVEL